MYQYWQLFSNTTSPQEIIAQTASFHLFSLCISCLLPSKFQEWNEINMERQKLMNDAMFNAVAPEPFHAFNY